ncbi:DUF1178 family protein [Oceanicola sp. S124]|uniref:DUF1178 family protein n=1 Tax=Oceanicola sp. S124 TaxID=1042378 RepID=UPI00025581DA|nr:DUF1178 family protein [Oceanicola sp. S124]
MIHFDLKCARGHGFDSWFQSSAAFDSLRLAGHVACPTCGSTEVEKALMAPRVRPSRTAAPVPAAESTLRAPRNEAEAALAELRRKVEENATYVGGNFAREARAIHEGAKPGRPIYGEAKPEEARALLEEGVPVLPLPFTPGRKAN